MTTDLTLETEVWEPLILSLKLKQCVPFLGAGVAHGCLPSGAALAETLADLLHYPFEDRDDLQAVSQFGATTRRDPIVPKNHIRDVLRDHLQSYLAGSTGQPPPNYQLLAGLDCPLYITTNYDDLLEQEFRRRQIEPVTEICRWNDELVRELGAYRRYDSASRQPVVFHLHGELSQLSSLMVTEDDYINFIVQLALESKANRKTMMWAPIVTALSARKLLFIGYSLKDVNFRVLMRYLFSHYKNIRPGLHISIQLAPDTEKMTAEQQERAQQYFQRYFEDSSVRLHWADGNTFLKQLHDRLADQ